MIFFKNHPHLKIPPFPAPSSSEKQTPSLKYETPFHEMFHEMIPRKSTINNDLKSLKNMCGRSPFLVNLEACRLIAGNFTIK